jgi:hypothetical protein
MITRIPSPSTSNAMSRTRNPARSVTNIALSDSDTRWFYETFPNGKISLVLSTLLQLFREEAEREEGSLDDILNRIQEKIQS